MRLVPVDEHGLRIGQDHHRARLTDAEVDLVRELHEAGMPYDALAKKFAVSKWSIGRICRYERRASTPARWVEAKKWRKK